MTDIAARLREVIEERLRVAREADTGERWLASSTGHGPAVGPWEREVPFEIWVCEDEMDGCPEYAREWEAEAKHIALNDPADAILAAEHSLEILARHERAGDGCCDWCREPVPDEHGLDEACLVDWPCVEITAMAKRYGVTE